MVQLNFDARTVEPSAGFDPVPKGWYKAIIDESGPMTPTKSGTGSYLPLRFSIVEGQYKGKKVFVRLNLSNPSQQAQEIAFKELSAIGHAVGVLMIEMSEQLHNKPLWISVTLRKGGTNEQTGEVYNDTNEISSYKDINFVPPNSGPAGPVADIVPPKAFTPPPVAAPVAPPAAVAPKPVAPTYEMASGETFTREQYHAAGWTDEALIQQGKMKVVAPAAPTPPAPTPPAPAANGPMPWASAPAQPWTAPSADAPAAPTAPVTPPPPAAVAAQSAAPPWSTPKA